MADLLDRANALVGTTLSSIYEGTVSVSQADLSNVFPTTVTSQTSYGAGRQSAFSAYTFTAATTDANGNVFITLHTTSKSNGFIGPDETAQVIGADNNVTLLGVGTYQPGLGFSNYILFSDVDLNPTKGLQTYPITDLSTSGFSAVMGMCYVAGTRLLTASGEVAIEYIVAGDLLAVQDDADGLEFRPVMWTGRRRIDLASSPAPELVRPIRIRAGAFAENVPHRDLLISPDHAVFTDGVLVPAHLLVNGGTIAQADTLERFEYLHVELDRHAVVLAEGLPAETYLPGANRLALGGRGVTALHPVFPDADATTYAMQGFAPLALDADRVQPIWARLADRSASLGLVVAAAETTANPALRIMAGETMLTTSTDGMTYNVAIPSQTGAIQLLSRAARPSDTRPWLDDRRMLGVMVQSIVLVTAEGRRPIAIGDAALTSGWWAIEGHGADARRWTNGEATIVLPATAGETVLEIALTGEMTYPLDLRRAA